MKLNDKNNDKNESRNQYPNRTGKTRKEKSILFPDKEFTLKIALDNGDLAGLTTTKTFFQDPIVSTETVSLLEKEPLKTLVVPENLQVLEHNYVLRGEAEPICEIEVIALLEDEPYRFIYDAQTGNEKDVERISLVERFYD